MSAVATAIVGGAVIGAYASSSASSKAADAQMGAAQLSSDTQMNMYNQTRADQTPWRDAGKVALGQLGTGTATGGEFNRDFTLSDFQKDPGYQFRMNEGMRGVQNSAAARGGLLNGGTLKALSQYGQDFASNEYQNAYNRFNTDRTNRFNRLASLAGVGQTANNAIAAAGANAANQVSSNQLAAGNAQASSYIGQANALNSGINSMQSLYTINKMFPSSTQSPSTGSTFTPDTSAYSNNYAYSEGGF